jgi:receptor expression-enhancing protein 5/6
MDILN